MSKKPNDYGKPMKCDGCDKCFEHPNYPGRCIYGGPYNKQKGK